MTQPEGKTPTLFQAFVPILVLMGLLVLNVLLFKDNSSYGTNQIALLLAAAVAAIIGIRLGYSWTALLEGIKESIKTALGAVIILLLIGALAGTWMISGIVPAMIVYGLQVLNPTIFLVATCLVCCVVSLATGSSWSTVATVGVALMGIGTALGFGPGWIAGSIISGAYFGDKLSPLSDTTNLAPALAGTDLFTHIRYMLYTTIPSISIALIVFAIAGFSLETESSAVDVAAIVEGIESSVNITPWLFLVPLLVIGLILKKVPAIPALLVGALLGGVAALVFQPELVQTIAENTVVSEKQDTRLSDYAYGFRAYGVVMNTMANGNGISTELESVNKLLSSDGMAGMLNTVWLILCALTFGGALQASGMLRRITAALLHGVKSTASLIIRTAGSSLFFNLTASDQYIAIVVPGKMFAEAYEDRGLAPENLSRTLEDSGTVTSALIPWNTCGAFHSTALGVDVMTYLPYAVFNYVSPLMTITYAIIGFKIRMLRERIGGEEVGE